jgi:hypothetical protein
MAEPQAPEIDTPAEAADERFEYVIKAPVEGVHAGYVVHLAKPNEAQLLVLLRLVDVIEDSAVDGARLYGDALESMMAPGEGHRVQRGLLKGHLEVEDFGNIGPAAIRHFYPEIMAKAEQKQHGPAATRKPRKR